MSWQWDTLVNILCPCHHKEEAGLLCLKSPSNALDFIRNGSLSQNVAGQIVSLGTGEILSSAALMPCPVKWGVRRRHLLGPLELKLSRAPLASNLL